MTDEPPVLLAVQEAAHAGLDALLSVVPLDLCAYLHVGEELGPQLYLRRPALAELDPADAFRLFSTLRDVLDGDDDAVTQVDAFHAVVEASSGTRSRSLWVAGRRDAPLGADEAISARSLGQAVMTICHLAEAAARTSTGPMVVRVTVDTTGDGATAEVVLDAGSGILTGQGSALTPLDAVASATLDALDPSLKLVAADEDSIDQSRAVLVLIRDDQGRSAVGAALCEGGSLRAAAEATLRAVGSLQLNAT